MQHYQLGQKVGDFTISSFDSDRRYYTLTCKCGNTTTGDSTHVTRKISNLLSDGYTACMSCYYKYKTDIKSLQESNAELYVHRDVYREYIKKSKERNIEFNLSLEECAPLFKSNCFYCDEKPLNKRTRDTGIISYYQGIDRIDNAKGYILDNVVPCCKYCNSFKMDRSQEDFYKKVENIYFLKVQRLEQTLVDPSGSKRKTPEKEEDIV